jgi:hypothetical protein
LTALAETPQLRMLEQLQRAGTQPVTLSELRSGGIDFPPVVLSELELNRYAIERVYDHDRLIGVCLLETEAPDTPPLTTAAPVAPSVAIASDRAKVRCWRGPLGGRADGGGAARRTSRRPLSASTREYTKLTSSPTWSTELAPASATTRRPTTSQTLCHCPSRSWRTASSTPSAV